MSFIRKAQKSHTSTEKPESLAVAYSLKKRKPSTVRPASEAEDDRPVSIADAVMRKKQAAKMMAEGGEVESPSPAESFEDLSEEAAMKELYEDENTGPDLEELNKDAASDGEDMISSIRAKLKAKRS